MRKLLTPALVPTSRQDSTACLPARQGFRLGKSKSSNGYYYRELTIIIPVRREEETIEKTIRLLDRTVRTSHTILIADDTVDSSDRTIWLVERMKQVFPPSRLSLDRRKIVISRKKRGDQDGFGPALVRAVRRVETPYTVFVMADACDDPKTIDRMMKVAKEKNCDVVVGSRYMKGGGKKGGPVIQGILSTWLNALYFLILQFPTRDATNAFKLYRTGFLKRIIPSHPKTGVEFSFELTIRAASAGASMIDVPTVWSGREKGSSKVRLFSRGPVYIRLLCDTLRGKLT